MRSDGQSFAQCTTMHLTTEIVVGFDLHIVQRVRRCTTPRQLVARVSWEQNIALQPHPQLAAKKTQPLPAPISDFTPTTMCNAVPSQFGRGRRMEDCAAKELAWPVAQPAALEQLCFARCWQTRRGHTSHLAAQNPFSWKRSPQET